MLCKKRRRRSLYRTLRTVEHGTSEDKKNIIEKPNKLKVSALRSSNKIYCSSRGHGDDQQQTTEKLLHNDDPEISQIQEKNKNSKNYIEGEENEKEREKDKKLNEALLLLPAQSQSISLNRRLQANDDLSIQSAVNILLTEIRSSSFSSVSSSPQTTTMELKRALTQCHHEESSSSTTGYILMDFIQMEPLSFT